jgi:hypothetical protein
MAGEAPTGKVRRGRTGDKRHPGDCSSRDRKIHYRSGSSVGGTRVTVQNGARKTTRHVSGTYVLGNEPGLYCTSHPTAADPKHVKIECQGRGKNGYFAALLYRVLLFAVGTGANRITGRHGSHHFPWYSTIPSTSRHLHSEILSPENDGRTPGSARWRVTPMNRRHAPDGDVEIWTTALPAPRFSTAINFALSKQSRSFRSAPLLNTYRGHTTTLPLRLSANRSGGFIIYHVCGQQDTFE